MKTLIILFVLLFNSFLWGDVVFFSNGIEEGYLSQEGDQYVLENKDRTGESSFYTGNVVRVIYGKWISDLNFIEKSEKIKKSEPKTTTQKIKKIIATKADQSKKIANTYTAKIEKNIGFEMPNQEVVPIFEDFREKSPVNFWALIVIFIVIIIKAIIVQIIIIIDAFKNSILHGLAVLFIPLYFWIYLFCFYEGSKFKSFFWIVLLPAIYTISFVSILTILSK